MSTTTSAILFIIFNRPDFTAKVFSQIRAARPQRLYIAADGPRASRADEADRCREARAVVSNIDWPCTVQTLFREKNLGCKEAVSSAIDWFFGHEEEGIILEDDCVPSPDFFPYCDTLLERYRHDTRVRHIGGSNLQLGQKRGEASYYFSRLTHVWGWASWRRAWRDYDKNLKAYSVDQIVDALANIFHEPLILERWAHITKELCANKIDTWDYQLGLTNFLQNGLCAIPNANLITNIGFGPGATHTINPAERYANMPQVPLGPITHPNHFLPDNAADNYTLAEEFQLNALREIRAKKQRKYNRPKYRFKRWLAAHGGPQRWQNAGT